MDNFQGSALPSERALPQLTILLSLQAAGGRQLTVLAVKFATRATRGYYSLGHTAASLAQALMPIAKPAHTPQLQWIQTQVRKPQQVPHAPVVKKGMAMIAAPRAVWCARPQMQERALLMAILRR